MQKYNGPGAHLSLPYLNCIFVKVHLAYISAPCLGYEKSTPGLIHWPTHIKNRQHRPNIMHIKSILSTVLSLEIILNYTSPKVMLINLFRPLRKKCTLSHSLPVITCTLQHQTQVLICWLLQRRPSPCETLLYSHLLL